MIPIKIYECQCGHLTPIDASEKPPVCSICGDLRFTRAHWYETRPERGAALWMHTLESTAVAAEEPKERRVARVSDTRLEDNKDNKLDFERARSVLIYFEMLKWADAARYADCDSEAQRILRRVIHGLRERQPEGDE